jgi:hypothetical protein
VLGDGWNDRINAAPLPPAIPGAAGLAGATVLETPPDLGSRDIAAVFRAVRGGWKTVNGYSGWAPSYYNPLIGAGRAEADAMVTPFRQFGELYVLVEDGAPRLRSVVEQQSGVIRVASDNAYTLYRMRQRPLPALPVPAGERLRLRELRSECSTTLLSLAIDGDETTIWQCDAWDERQTMIADLGEPKTVGSVVESIGAFSYLYSGALYVDTSEDGVTWTPGWSGPVFERQIVAAMADPRRLRVVAAFDARSARYVRLRADKGGPDIPWTIAELEVWSASSEAR